MCILHIKIQVVPHRGHCACIIQTSLWKLSKNVMVVYCKTDAEHTNAMCAGNAEF